MAIAVSPNGYNWVYCAVAVHLVLAALLQAKQFCPVINPVYTSCMPLFRSICVQQALVCAQFACTANGFSQIASACSVAPGLTLIIACCLTMHC
jgi:hypothetical protein